MDLPVMSARIGPAQKTSPLPSFLHPSASNNLCPDISTRCGRVAFIHSKIASFEDHSAAWLARWCRLASLFVNSLKLLFTVDNQSH